MNTVPHSFPADVKPPSQTDLVDEALYAAASMRFEMQQDGPWRTVLAEQLNVILGRVAYVLETDGDATDLEFAKAALSVVERVAEFEEIKRVP